MDQSPLAGLRLLLLEDELLIAMDVEQLCLDHGAAHVAICQTVEEAAAVPRTYHAAILDLSLGGESTLPFAARLHAARVPFIFATGTSEWEQVREAFPGIKIVGKPYHGRDLVAAVTEAVQAGSADG